MYLQQPIKIFLTITIVCSILLAYLFYKDYKFNNNPLELKYQKQIELKTAQLQLNAYKKYKIRETFPIIISDEMPFNRYGATTFERDGKIRIYLNKHRFKEESHYMVTSVLPHEYAHAVMFYFKDFTKVNSGHTKRWENICKNLGGLKCNRFVQLDDILIEKLNIK